MLDLLRSLPGTTVVTASEASGAPVAAWGDSLAVYDPNGDLPTAQQRPFTTVVVQDVPGWDVASRLDRADVFRVNIEVGSRRYAELLGHPPAEHADRRDAYDYAPDSRLGRQRIWGRRATGCECMREAHRILPARSTFSGRHWAASSVRSSATGDGAGTPCGSSGSPDSGALYGSSTAVRRA